MHCIPLIRCIPSDMSCRTRDVQVGCWTGSSGDEYYWNDVDPKQDQEEVPYDREAQSLYSEELIANSQLSNLA